MLHCFRYKSRWYICFIDLFTYLLIGYEKTEESKEAEEAEETEEAEDSEDSEEESSNKYAKNKQKASRV